MTQKDSCLICQIVSGKVPSFKVYEDDICIVVLDVNGANPGHCFIIPKQHYPIMEQVPDAELANLFAVSNKISSSIFENLKAEGTNIFVRNGIPAGQTVAHFMISVIPRKENDGINLQWQPKQLSEDEIATVEVKLKDQIKDTGVEQVQQIATTKESKPSKKSKEAPQVTDDEDDYFTKQMRRIP